jgi:chromosome segregation ATPase
MKDGRTALEQVISETLEVRGHSEHAMCHGADTSTAVARVLDRLQARVKELEEALRHSTANKNDLRVQLAAVEKERGGAQKAVKVVQEFSQMRTSQLDEAEAQAERYKWALGEIKRRSYEHRNDAQTPRLQHEMKDIYAITVNALKGVPAEKESDDTKEGV